MLCLLVAVKFILLIEMFVASGARILVLTLAVVNFVFVGFQVVCCLEDPLTYITIKSASYTMYSQHMQI